jgi:hypothetical protein
MTEPRAATLATVDVPRLPIEALCDLRALIQTDYRLLAIGRQKFINRI